MTIQVRFFGDLRKKIQQEVSPGGIPIIRVINDSDIETISDILEKFSIKKEETSHIFVNGTYAGFSKKVENGDRVGLFPKNMSLLYKWYFTRTEDD